MRILSITAQKPNSTGSGVYLTELVKVMAEEGHQQAVIAGVYREDVISLPESVDFYPVYFHSEALPFSIVGMSDMMPYPNTRYRDLTPEMLTQFRKAFLRQLDAAVEQFQPDLILCHHLYLLTALVREHLPKHKIYGFCHGTCLRQLEKISLEQAYICTQLQKLDRIFALQKPQAEKIAELLRLSAEAAQQKITVVGTGYNGKIFHKAEGERVPRDPVQICFAGKITEKKGVVSLIRCLSQLVQTPEQVEFYLIGGHSDQEEYDRIRHMAEESPYSIYLLGRVSQNKLVHMYQTSQVFVLPSFFEGIPLVAVEAMACGAKLVITELPGVREWFVENIPNANIRYVPLPEMRNVDEPIPSALPVFEQRLAATLSEAIADPNPQNADTTHLHWERIVHIVLHEAR